MSVSSLPKNLAALCKNKTVSMFQDPETLKTDSLILASLVLVISRSLVANLSAIQAVGTPEGPYRYRQATQTVLREGAGWTFGFIVLRQVQNWIRKSLAKPLGISRVGEPVKYPFGENLAKVLSGKPPAPLNLDLTRVEGLRYNPEQASQKVVQTLKKFKPFEWLGKNEAQRMLTLYKAAPIALGSIPAVFLAGYALERFTRDYSDHVVDLVSKTFNKSKDAPLGGAPQMTPPAPAPVQPVQPIGQLNQLSIAPPVTPMMPNLAMPPMAPVVAPSVTPISQFTGRQPSYRPIQPFKTSFAGMQI